MSSILTNNSAMVALQTLKTINSGLSKTQSEISTGKAISTAKDNAAIWSIAKTMESDTSAIKTISTGLNTANSTVATARSAVEDISEALDKIKSKVLTAQTASANDRATLQADIDGYVSSIRGVLKTAQFNGVNLIDGSSTADYEVVSSLDRSAAGVSASKISVERQNLSMSGSTAATFGATAITTTAIINNGGTAAGSAAAVAAGATQNISIGTVGAGYSYRIAMPLPGATSGTGTFEYVAGANDSAEDVATKLGNQMSAYLQQNGLSSYSVSVSDNRIRFTNDSAAAVNVTATTATGGTAASGGGLSALNGLSVTSDANAAAALASMEGLIATATKAAANFGLAQNQIENQTNFISKLSDNLTSGIGSLVDADMEEASARLQALQTQQQLGIQALSIANQAPSSILSLFRG
ncbi:flagellin [Paracoccus yeei]|jgi:flagellin|uniref:Flagellin n=2 Tax=Paracoccus TaxID=265 RepID=A0A1V0GX28_9RHOB|nr:MULTISPECIES: flagellin [Paracoccus]ARC38377.1 flagellin [Paracoccus yeei]ATQ56642.1 flagellin [Paracoccus yeei]AWX94322.1 flagellin [Paracoccus mutanolyticus]OWJ97134.1 flagellin [Paracoccus yeei]